ncbi:hypothetical protein ACTXIZ_13210, partial [Psychrobacter celer]
INIVSFLGTRTRPFEKSDYIELMTDNSTGLELTFKIIEKRVKGWNAFYTSLSKGDKDKITAWRRGDDLPSYGSLLAILNPKHHDISKNILIFLITARAIGYFKKHNDFELLTQYLKPPTSFKALMVQFEDLLLALHERDMQYVATLYQNKDEQFLHRPSTIILELLTYSLSSFSKDEIEKAKEYFVNTFELSLYRSGHLCEQIIEVGFVIASWQERPDMNLISKLKSVQNLYGYTLPTILTEDTKRKKENLVEDWEINMWRSNAQKVFNNFKVELPEKYRVSSAVL